VGKYLTHFFLTIILFDLGVSMETVGQWSTDPNVNNAICTATGGQQDAMIVSDGSGGAIIAWDDVRSGYYHIYAERINAAGSICWTLDGVAICTAAGNQQNPVLVSDGLGGAIITWMDSRNGNYDIYAQRINASGAIQWTTNGIAVCTAAADQYFPVIIADDAGGAIVAWQDNRSGNFDIYAQRINASGTVQWNANGAAICVEPGGQDAMTLAGDGAGGAIITWEDIRGGSYYDIYAQRINAAGAVQWTANGVIVCSAAASQQSPTIVSDGVGGAIIAWYDLRSVSSHIYAQRVNASGAVQWTADGVAICTAAGNQTTPVIAGDGSRGAIIAWKDGRGIFDYDLYAQRIDASGSVQWATNGVAICTATDSHQSPMIVSDPSGGAIITWYDNRSGNNDIYAQRINTSGIVQWPTNGAAICIAPGDQYTPIITNDGTGGVVITWTDSRSGTYHIYAQRVDRLGNLYPAPWIQKVGDIANDQGGKLRILWNPSSLDIWGNTTVKSYTLKIGVKAIGLLGKTSQVPGDGVYWQSAGSVAADWSDGYSMVTTTHADSGLQGIPYYYFQVIAKNADSTIYWSSNIDSGYSVDNIPPVGVSGSSISSGPGGNIDLTWNKDRVDPDLMGYRVFRSALSGFLLNDSVSLAFSQDTTYQDTTGHIGQTYFYRVAAVDVHGNLGTPSAELSQTVLSITLSAFSATVSRLDVELHWTVKTETNNYGYEIERRLSNVPQSTFQAIGFVEGSGNANAPRDYSFTDKNLIPSVYVYRLKLIDRNGNFRYSQNIETEVVTPKVYELSQNYPNPFNPATTIQFSIADLRFVELKIFDLLGREVRTLVSEERAAGSYSAKWDASNLPSGTYIYRLKAGSYTETKKMILMK